MVFFVSMESLKELYRIGHGPSSSHTMGPKKAAEMFLGLCPNGSKYVVTLYGSLAATGKGHLTEVVLGKTFEGRDMEIVWEPKTFLPLHPNALKFESIDAKGEVQNEWTAYSIGGGKVIDENTKEESLALYEHSTMNEILEFCNSNGLRLWEYVERAEGEEIWTYLAEIWETMKDAVKRGLDQEGQLPGGLKLPRKAAEYRDKAVEMSGPIKKNSLLFSYALAVSEENASGGKIVTAPTCGASGVIPAVLYYHQKVYKLADRKILRALATAGLVGNLAKHNASISGAEVGCQGEVGVACAMASAAAAQLSGGSNYQIEYAAEMGLEHHLGLTCDPVAGLVQIPCIERNAFAAARSLNHGAYAILSDGRHRISYDEVVEVMKKTGKDLPSFYKETSTGGLALFNAMPR